MALNRRWYSWLSTILAAGIVVGLPNRGAAQAGEVACGSEISGCLGSAFIGLTGREPDELIAAEVRREIVDFPVASPSGGFSISFVRGTRTPHRLSTSFGPAFGQRALTQGRHQIAVGLDYQFYTYGRIVGSSDLSTSVIYLNVDQPLWVNRTVVDLKRHVLNTHVTYGLTERADVFFLAPFAWTYLSGTHDRGVPARVPDVSYRFSGKGASVGDVAAGFKAVVGQGFARFGTVGRIDFPTGSETQLTGLGYARLKVTGVWSGNAEGLIQPHANVSFIAPIGKSEFREFDITGKELAVRPNQVEMVIGSDVAVTPRLTMTLDALTRWTLRSAYVEFGRVRPAIVLGIEIDGEVVCCINAHDTYFPVASDVVNGVVAIGGKYNVSRRNLLVANLVVPFGRYTIRPRPTIAVGLSLGM